MIPTKEVLFSCDKTIDEKLTEEHLSRLDESYFITFNLKQICSHLKALAKVNVQSPVVVHVEKSPEGLIECNIFGFDYPSEFSLITGILTATGFSIVSGSVFVYAPSRAHPSHRRVHPSRRGIKNEESQLKRRRVVQQLVGRLPRGTSVTGWEEQFVSKLNGVVNLLEQKGTKGMTQAKQRVNEMVAAAMQDVFDNTAPTLYPVEIEVDNQHPQHTTLKITSQDTPAFLYSLSNALALRRIVIEGVRIDTREGILRDEIDIVDSAGKKIIKKEKIDQLKLSVLLTKQYTYFLEQAPDRFAALSRFDCMIDDILKGPEHGKWLELFSDHKAFKELARILGASDFIWEDFIRAQYETLLPILNRQRMAEPNRISCSVDELDAKLQRQLDREETFEKKKSVLNAFKDSEIFRIDLEHILDSEDDIRSLSVHLSQLAEVIVRHSSQLAYEKLVTQYGVPRTVGGLAAKYGIMGLGKLGGEAIGYASDIELLFVYSDNGHTDGEIQIENPEFFDKLVEETASCIVTKQEGIFQVDLRLRPYGESGHKACSIESFCNYYGPSGDSHSYERLALVRLRAVGGDKALGEQLERLRDAFIYETHAIDMKELQALRERQLEHKASRNKGPNVKFSQGALVDIEYYVQILQVVYGGDIPELRTPKIHVALSSLSDRRILDEEESAKLTEAYYFFRRVINGLRMLRGNALDLFLPPETSDEYAHLARRVGYKREGGLAAKSKLYMEFETATAVVRTFIERHFGREAMSDASLGNVADLVLSMDAPDALKERVLKKIGFVNVDRAYINLLRLSGSGEQRHIFARLAVLACDVLKRSPDPDMAFNNWERFVNSISHPRDHYHMLLSQPRRLEILLGILAGSQFLADTLVKNPDFLDWVTDPANLRGMYDRSQFVEHFKEFLSNKVSFTDFLNAVRRFRRRAILRIGTRDICLRKPVQEVVGGLSYLAETLINATLSRVCQEVSDDFVSEVKQHLCVLAFGKLGGEELNYSSDIDLLVIYDDEKCTIPTQDAESLFARIVNRLSDALSVHTEEGYAYRVDLRLRPHGISGKLVPPVSSVAGYYDKQADLWEIQALLKLRPVAGNLEVGHRLINNLMPIVSKKRPKETIAKSIQNMREKALQKMGIQGDEDIKSGIGGIRDIEFLVQGMQLTYLHEFDELYTGNTLEALERLRQCSLLDEEMHFTLSKDYLFLRRVEHYLQILEDRQTHLLPRHKAELGALARRLFGPSSNEQQLIEALSTTRTRTRQAFEDFLQTETLDQ